MFIRVYLPVIEWRSMVLGLGGEGVEMLQRTSVVLVIIDPGPRACVPRFLCCTFVLAMQYPWRGRVSSGTGSWCVIRSTKGKPGVTYCARHLPTLAPQEDVPTDIAEREAILPSMFQPPVCWRHVSPMRPPFPPLRFAVPGPSRLRMKTVGTPLRTACLHRVHRVPRSYPVVGLECPSPPCTRLST